MPSRRRNTSSIIDRRGEAKKNKRQLGITVFVFLVVTGVIGWRHVRLMSRHGLSNLRTATGGTRTESTGVSIQHTNTSTTSNNPPGDPRLPQRPKRRITKPTDKILVAYSGPTELLDRSIPVRNDKYEHLKELYRLNFEHFLKYGVQCKTQDTVLVVTSAVEPVYRAQVDRMHEACNKEYGSKVILAIRNNTCLDLESVRRVMRDNIVDIDSYDYFVYVNCGTSGPSRAWADLPWTDVLLEKLSDKVKMSGLSLNCQREGESHIQSMVYALDRVSLKLIRENEDVIFDCVKKPSPDPDELVGDYIIDAYEIGMSTLLFEHGYGVANLLYPTVRFKDNKNTCNDTHVDPWLTDRMMANFGRVLDLEDTVFFKTSRLISKATAKEINYTLEVNWAW
jgi:hypothetical protein